MRRRRLGALPIVLVIAAMLVGLIGLTATPARPAAPLPSPDRTVTLPPGTPRPTETPLGRYPPNGEATIVGNCVAGIDPQTVPQPITQAFCICTLNRYERLYPTYDEFQRAAAAGAISERTKTDISNACVQAIVGG